MAFVTRPCSGEPNIDSIRLLPEPDNLEGIWMPFSKRDDKSHLLWTEAYVAAFAQAAQAELVTLDRFEKRYPAVHITRLA